MNILGYFLFLSGVFSSFAWADCPNEKVIPNKYLVRIKSSGSSFNKLSANDPRFEFLHSEFNSTNSQTKQMSESLLYRATLSPEEATALSTAANVENLEQDCEMELFALPNDPNLLAGDNMSPRNQIRLPQAWNIIRESSVIVAVSDTGVDLNHPDLKENLWNNGDPSSKDYWGWAVADVTEDPTPGTFPNADHGTHIAGIIGASGNNLMGSAGVAWKTKIMALRPFRQSSESLAVSDGITSIRYAVDHGAKVINLSWGQRQVASIELQLAIAYAEANGVLIVAAAGNKADNFLNYSPVSLPTVVSVGSINSRSRLSTFTNFGLGLSLLAPGGDEMRSGVGLNEGIFSTLPTTSASSFGLKTGTSFAAPFVSGVAALAYTLLPNLKPSEMRRLLKEGADQATYGFFGSAVPSYKLNAEKTLQMAFDLAQKNPQCSENCAFAIAGAQADGVEKINFGGGCTFSAPKTSTAGFDFSWLLMLMMLFRKRKSRPS